MTAIIRKELRGYFNSWIGYIFLFILVGLVGVFFALINLNYQMGNFQDTLTNITIFLLILVPVLTMRLFAEEARQRTDQLLFTSPITVMSIVLGKFLSAFVLACIGLGLTLIFPLMIIPYGTLPGAEIFVVYLGYALLIACYISVGMFISACTENQIIAAVITFFVMIFMYIMDGIAAQVTNIVTASQSSSSAAMISLLFVAIIIAVLAYIIYDATKNYYATGGLALILIAVATGLYVFDASLFDGFLTKSIQWVSVMSRFTNFENGVLNVSDIIYYISFAALFIYLSVNAIEKKRWK
ncbi:MAG: ABC transporter permease [Clostridiales bacterium]|nr:ABC transporter permease [Clostridiales bacterium]